MMFIHTRIFSLDRELRFSKNRGKQSLQLTKQVCYKYRIKAFITNILTLPTLSTRPMCCSMSEVELPNLGPTLSVLNFI